MDHGEMLSIQDVQELGISCRLALTPEELEKYRGDLNDLLALIAVLEETEAQEASPIGSATLAELREDAEPTAPLKEQNGTYWVPSVMEK